MRPLTLSAGLGVLAFCWAVASASPEEAVLGTDDVDTVLLLHLDGDTRDASGCRHAMRVVGGSVTFGAGHLDRAARTARQGLIASAPAGALRIGDQSWTVECWVRALGNGGPMSGSPVRGGFGPARSFGIGLSDGVPSAFFHAGSGRTAEVRAMPGVRVSDGAWHVLAGVLDRERGGEVRLYVDGVDVGAGGATQPHAVEFGGPVGRVQLCAGYAGWIDEVRITRGVRPAYRVSGAASRRRVDPRDRASVRRRLMRGTRGGPKALAVDPESTLVVVPAVGRVSPEHNAATLLQTWLRARYATQTGFVIVEEDEATDLVRKTVIAVGDTVLSDLVSTSGLSPYGFGIVRRNRAVVIAGATEAGVHAGAAYFLDRFCDVRSYLPTDLFTHCPTHGGVTLGEIDTRVDPALKAVTMTGVGASLPDEMHAWRRLNTATRDRYFYYRSHGLGEVLDIEAMARDEPGMFALIDGVRRVPGSPGVGRNNWQLCCSHPDLVDVALEGVVAWFRRNPHLANVHLPINDSAAFCECEHCRSAVEEATGPLPRARAMTDLYVAFIRKLAGRMEEALPQHGVAGDKILSYSAYGKVRLAPSAKLPPNVMPILVFKISDCQIDGVFDEGRAVARATYGDEMPLAERWRPLASCFGHHDWAQGQGYFIPRVYTHHYQRTLQEFGPSLEFMHLEGYPNWGLDGPKVYMFTRLGWDPDLDLDALWRQFCDEMFGPAAGSMYAYFRGLEGLWDQLNGKRERKFIGRLPYRSQFQTDAEDQERYRELRTYLDAASKQAVSEAQRRRIELFDTSFAFTELLLSYAGLPHPDSARAAAIRDYAAEKLLPEPLTVFRWGTHSDKGRAELLKRVDDAIRNLDAD